MSRDTSRVGHRPEHLDALRHLTVVRVMIGHFSWTLSVNDADGIRVAADRLRQEMNRALSPARPRTGRR